MRGGEEGEREVRNEDAFSHTCHHFHIPLVSSPRVVNNILLAGPFNKIPTKVGYNFS